MSKIYDFKVKDITGKKVELSKYKGKAMLFVNVASECGFTSQYEGLEEIYKANSDKLVVLGFPCNQFGAQEPGDNAAIANFCRSQFGVEFPMFSKIDVNGKDTDPVFEYLKEELPGLLGSKKVKWNFTKFLVDLEGKPVKRFAPKDKPSEVLKFI